MYMLLLSCDLMLAAAAEGAARRREAAVLLASGEDEAVRQCADATVQLVVIDLRLSGLDVQALVPRLRAVAPRAAIVACAPHVHVDSLAAAKAAGCDAVFTRGEIERRVDSLLAALTTPG